THLPDVTVITPVYLDKPSPQPSPASGRGSQASSASGRGSQASPASGRGSQASPASGTGSEASSARGRGSQAASEGEGQSTSGFGSSELLPLPPGEGGGEGIRPMFYVGSRGHHADIGGTTPGSMPPFSTRIEEEGVQIDNVKLVDRGTLR